jgi:hypothetical protein
MPDYGTLPADEGTGLLPWSWAVERLEKAHDYWVATTYPDGRPHVTPVWGMWLDDAVWFSCGPNSRKSRNLERDPRCTIATDIPSQPVVIEAVVTRRPERDDAARFAELSTIKYEVEYSVDFFHSNALYEAKPVSAFGLVEDDFTGSPTKWTFP